MEATCERIGLVNLVFDHLASFAKVGLTIFSDPDSVREVVVKSSASPLDDSHPRSTFKWPAGPVRRCAPGGELWINSLTGFVSATNHPDQPWKIARMNKLSYALALGAGLALSLACPNAGAGVISQDLSPTNLSATTFNSLFTASSAALTQTYQFNNTPTSGVVESQVFTGNQGTAAAGLYAYAYQFGVNNVTDTTGQATSVNSAALIFNATPVPTNFTGATTNSDAYVVTNGQIGNINVPTAAPGNVIQTPSQIIWQPNATTGSLAFQYLDSTSNSGPLAAGATSGTIVVISNQPFTEQLVSLQNPDPQTSYPFAYSPTGGTIQEIPAPEPTTVLAWASVLGALAIARKVRQNRSAA